MESRAIGPIDAPVVGLGCNNFGRRIDATRSAEVVAAAIDAGVSFFDTADIYGDGLSERYLGDALGPRRRDVTVATKFGMTMRGDPAGDGGHPDWIRTAVDASLQRLGTEQIDLYQMHRPDDAVPIGETLGALDELVRDGKVRAIGCSNFSAEQIDEAMSVAEDEGLTPFVSVQNRYSILHREPESNGVIDACVRHGLALIPYFPLESGLLTGKYVGGFDGAEGRLSGLPDERRDRFADAGKLEATDRLSAYAQSRGRTILELAISWLLARPAVSCVIAGATRPDQVRANVAAAAWTLEAEEFGEIDRILNDLPSPRTPSG
jgi:aryl-alcohol dehydrogenase-like predicted oxidoreductase